MQDIRTVAQDNGITAAYRVDRRGDWHLIARSDVPDTSRMSIALEVHICDQRRSYTARFATEQQAVAFIAARSANHAFFEIEGEPIPEAATQLINTLYPLCEHQMSAASCYGPDHFMTAAQEAAMGWDYADAPAGF